MKSKVIFLLIMSLLLACQTVPVTHRSQLSLIPSDQMMAMSFNSYGEFLQSHKVVKNTAQARMVQEVGMRIEHAVERYFSDHNMANRLKGYRWEFELIQDDAANAWAMPGGKVVVYTGILPITQNETGLAVVMGHEIGHAVAEHGNERMSQALIAQLGGIALSSALSRYPGQTQQLFMAAYGVGSQVGVLLPYSRLQESEADHLGLIFMAIAGYDPRSAVDFWERMLAAQVGGSGPEFLSTHPSDRTRIENIRQLIPEAMKYYK